MTSKKYKLAQDKLGALFKQHCEFQEGFWLQGEAQLQRRRVTARDTKNVGCLNITKKV